MPTLEVLDLSGSRRVLSLTSHQAIERQLQKQGFLRLARERGVFIEVRPGEWKKVSLLYRPKQDDVLRIDTGKISVSALGFYFKQLFTNLIRRERV